MYRVELKSPIPLKEALAKFFLQFQQRNYSNNRTQIAGNSRNMATTYLGRYQGERWEAE